MGGAQGWRGQHTPCGHDSVCRDAIRLSDNAELVNKANENVIRADSVFGVVELKPAREGKCVG